MAGHSVKEIGHTKEHHSTPLCMSSINHYSTTVGQNPFHSASRSDIVGATYFIIIYQIHNSTTYVATLRILPIL